MTFVVRARFGAWAGCLAASLLVAGSHFAAAQATPESKPAAEKQEPAAEELSAEDKELLARYEAKQKLIKSLGTMGPTIGRLGDVAEINVPKGYVFIASDKINDFNLAHGNTTDPGEVGALQHESLSHFIIFEWDDGGYVKDDEKETLDADALLKSMQQGQEQDNEVRRKENRPTLTLSGWQQPPHYDEKTNHLTWGLKLQSRSGGESVNYNSRILGRSGVMSAVLVCSPDALDEMLKPYNELLVGYKYVEGERYADWKSGDRVAAYGLGALVAGGALAVAAKTGFLGKMLKPLLYGAIAVFAGISAFFKRMFGGGKKTV